MSSKQIQRITPFIRPIRVQGGSFYVFKSSEEDLTFSFNTNTTKKFKFSKFALLNIPEIRNSPIENTIKLDAISGAFNYIKFNETNNWNTLLAESFQNYCLNLETSILARTDYDSSVYRTVSERVFFKWLKEIAAIRFDEAHLSGLDGVRYTEEQDTTNKYKRVVKYIGDIDFVNNYTGPDNSYSEVYIHVPTEVGDFPEVYFKSIEDANYRSSMSICRSDEGVDSDVILGRHYDDIHPNSLNFNAFYDNAYGLNAIGQDSLMTINFYKKIVGRRDDQQLEQDYILNDWWYPPTITKHCYYTEPNGLGDYENDDLALYKEVGIGSNTGFETGATLFRRSRLDGISIDFDPNTYANLGTSIDELIDVARNDNSKDFEFNAVLVYYDIYENITTQIIDDYDEFGNPIYLTSGNDYNILATNLFGILFLDNVESGISLGGGLIPTFKKCRPNAVTKLNGNAYGFKLNLRLDTSPVDSGVQVETVISNSNTLSMDIYAKALTEMYRVSELVNGWALDLLDIDSRFFQMDQIISLLNPRSVSALSNRIDNIESLLTSTDNYTMKLAKDKSEILTLIQQNYDTLRQILSGKAPTKLLLDTDIFIPGTGININKTTQGKLILSSVNQNYNYDEKIVTSIVNDWNITDEAYVYETNLKSGKNYLRISDNNFLPKKHLKLYIKDYNNNWSVGQIFRIYFENEIPLKNTFGNFIFYIYTDYKNLLGNSNNYSKLIISFNNSNFEKYSNRPIFEIHCINDKTFNFLIDYL